MGTKLGSGREDDLKLWGAFCRCADRRYQWIRCGARAPSQGMGPVLGSGAAAAVLGCGERPDQQGVPSEGASWPSPSAHPMTADRRRPPLSRGKGGSSGLFAPMSNVWMKLSALSRILELTKGSEAARSGRCHRVRLGYLAKSFSLRSGDGGARGKGCRIGWKTQASGVCSFPRSSETYLLFIIAEQPRPEGVTSTGHMPKDKRRRHSF